MHLPIDFKKKNFLHIIMLSMILYYYVPKLHNIIYVTISGSCRRTLYGSFSHVVLTTVLLLVCYHILLHSTCLRYNYITLTKPNFIIM